VVVVRRAQADTDSVVGESVEFICGHFASDLRTERYEMRGAFTTEQLSNNFTR
jgi:hypothetical protein